MTDQAVKNDPILWYFADPMCSWCWGFAPVISSLKKSFEGQLKIALVLGGLRPGGKDPLTSELRSEILHHWHAVHDMTGQNFTYDNALPEGFVYDTEPASRAVVSVGELRPAFTFGYFKAIQKAFYVNQVDVTKADNLCRLAQDFDITEEEFMQTFDAQETQQKTYAHFHKSRQFGVRGFPTTIWQTGEEYKILCNGYSPVSELQPRLEAWLVVDVD